MYFFVVFLAKKLKKYAKSGILCIYEKSNTAKREKIYRNI